jgi:glutaredoxin
MEINKSAKPDANTKEPDANPTKPDANPTKPDVNPTKPDANTKEPAATTTKEPAATSTETKPTNQTSSSQNPEVTKAENAIEQHKADPKMVVMISLEGCPYCTEAKTLISQKGYKLNEILITKKNKETFQKDFENNKYNTTKQRSFPMCFIQEKLIGGFDNLKKMFESKKPLSTTISKIASRIQASPTVSAIASKLRNNNLEEGIVPKVSDVFRKRDLNFGPIASTIGTNIDPMYSDLKRCLCDGFAEIFASIAPLIIVRVIDSIKESLKSDPRIREHIESRLIQLVSEIKSSSEKDMILTNLDGECKEVYSVTK